MSSLSNLSIRRPVATAMAFLILIVLGILSLRSLPVDLLPKIEMTRLNLRVSYPNVGPEEIEQIIADPIENAVSGLPNLERVTTNAEEGSVRIGLEFAAGTDIDEAANDLRAALDRIRTQLPVEADAPRIFKFDLDSAEVVGLAATSTHGLDQLTELLEDDIGRRFEQIPGVGALEVRGAIRREIRVELDLDRMQAAGLTALDIEQALRRENVTLPGGNVKSGLADLYVRSIGDFENVEQIARTVITHVGGLPVRVADIATVKDDYEDTRTLVEVNGVPSIGLSIQKQSGANTVEVARAIRREVDRINAERSDVKLWVIFDQSDFIRQSISNVRTSALWGSLLAILVLYFFLRNRSSTLIIALSIPISVISTFSLLYFGGLTLNQMTFGGLALGVGLIVDNAIVVLESIVRKREETDLTHRESARVGASDVAGAIVASTLTTCVIFLPVVFTSSVSGMMFRSLALVVVFALACSLFVALALVPMLSARFLKLPSQEQRQRSLILRSMTALEGWYTGRLRAATQHRVRIFAGTAVLLLAAVLLFPLIPLELTPPSDADEIDIDVEMGQGTNIAVARSYLQELEYKVLDVLPTDDVLYFTSEVWGDNARVELKLVPESERKMKSSVLADQLREQLQDAVPGGEIRVRASQGLWILRRLFSRGGGEEAVQLELRGWSLDQADVVAQEVRGRVQTIPGVTDVRVSRREGRPEAALHFDRERMAELGLSVRDVGRTIQANVGGIQAGQLREGGDEYPIVVRLEPDDRLAVDDLRGVSLRTPAGATVPLSALVRRERTRAPTEIRRIDGQRVTYITAELESGVPLGEAIEKTRVALADLRLPDGFSLLYGGQYEEQLEARRDFIVAIVMALALVYMLLAAQFERFIDPMIVMLAVPMALIGVVPTLLLTGTTLNIQSVMGLVMLIGIVVNNAIVLVDTINLLRREHDLGAADAVIEAGRLRLRPILMTTSTTVLGLMPLAIGLGAGAEMQAALARVVIGGLSASTLITLVLIPVTYVTVAGWVARLRASRWMPSEEAAEAAGRAASA